MYIVLIVQVSINFGTVLGYNRNYTVIKLNLSQLFMVNLGAISPILLAIKVLAICNSPLAHHKGCEGDAKHILTKTSHSEEDVACGSLTSRRLLASRRNQ